MPGAHKDSRWPTQWPCASAMCVGLSSLSSPGPFEWIWHGKKELQMARKACTHTHTHTHAFVVPRSAHHTARETHMRDESFVNAHAARTHTGCHASTHAAWSLFVLSNYLFFSATASFLYFDYVCVCVCMTSLWARKLMLFFSEIDELCLFNFVRVYSKNVKW